MKNLKEETFDEYYKRHPYTNTNSFTESDWHFSMWQNWYDEQEELKKMKVPTEQKEIFTPEDLFKKYSNLYQFEEGSPEYLLDLEDFKAAIKENEEANAFLIAESKNMYYALKDIVPWMENLKDKGIFLNGTLADLYLTKSKEILNRINK